MIAAMYYQEYLSSQSPVLVLQLPVAFVIS